MQATWILPDGHQITAHVPSGQSLMQAALANNVPFVIGECGGNLSCATCHVVIAPEWKDRAGGPGAVENSMLDITEAERQPASRLSCQIRMSAALDGIVLHVPQP
jgi:ferredoxin, 2Fe-2S